MRMCILKKSYNPNLCRVYFYKRIDSEEDDLVMVDVYLSPGSMESILTLPISQIESVTEEQVVFIGAHPYLEGAVPVLSSPPVEASNFGAIH